MITNLASRHATSSSIPLWPFASMISETVVKQDGLRSIQRLRARRFCNGRDCFVPRGVAGSVSRNIRADFLKDDLFNLFRETFGDFQVSQDMA
jgi:hypothetical protein